jgi:hypothetical protein
VALIEFSMVVFNLFVPLVKVVPNVTVFPVEALEEIKFILLPPVGTFDER